MNQSIKDVARAVQKLTYDEMMVVAGWLSCCTAFKPNGDERAPLVSTEKMAAHLSDWAEEFKNGAP